MANYNPAGWKNADVGINHTPAYQVSGRPFASGGIEALSVVEVKFPYVTRWVQVINKAGTPLKVAFSHEGLNVAGTGSESFYYTVDASGSNGYGKSEVYEMKVSSLWFVKSGSADGSNVFNVVAGLTSIDSRKTANNFTGSYEGV
tara:strand:+ start:1374 stop:1808 length:435 start_codon:yes stop_codon:yes gene_type:complete